MNGNERISPRENPRGDRFEDRRRGGRPGAGTDPPADALSGRGHRPVDERCGSADAKRLDQGYELLSAAVDDGMARPAQCGGERTHGGGWVKAESQFRNPKFEILNKSQIGNPKVRNTPHRTALFVTLEFRIWSLFRISCLGFRISVSVGSFFQQEVFYGYRVHGDRDRRNDQRQRRNLRIPRRVEPGTGQRGGTMICRGSSPVHSSRWPLCPL